MSEPALPEPALPEPALPYPDPGPATTRPRRSPNGTVPPAPSVPPMPSEVKKERIRSQRPATGGFHMMMPLRKLMHRAPRPPVT